MFVNLSNHPSAMWSTAQLVEAQKYGEILDLPFPQVPARATVEQVADLAEDTVARVLELRPEMVMCQGEFTLTYAIVTRLKAAGVTVVAACSERMVEERMVDGEYKKTISFAFEQFRAF